MSALADKTRSGGHGSEGRRSCREQPNAPVGHGIRALHPQVGGGLNGGTHNLWTGHDSSRAIRGSAERRRAQSRRDLKNSTATRHCARMTRILEYRVVRSNGLSYNGNRRYRRPNSRAQWPAQRIRSRSARYCKQSCAKHSSTMVNRDRFHSTGSSAGVLISAMRAHVGWCQDRAACPEGHKRSHPNKIRIRLEQQSSRLTFRSEARVSRLARRRVVGWLPVVEQSTRDIIKRTARCSDKQVVIVEGSNLGTAKWRV